MKQRKEDASPTMPETISESKRQPWVKPVIKAQANFDKQAIACSFNNVIFPCNSQASG